MTTKQTEAAVNALLIANGLEPLAKRPPVKRERKVRYTVRIVDLRIDGISPQDIPAHTLADARDLAASQLRSAGDDFAAEILDLAGDLVESYAIEGGKVRRSL